MVRYHAFAEAGLIPKTALKGLDALPNYSKWSKAIHGRDEVMAVFDGPTLAEKTKERIAKMKAQAQ